MRESRRSKIPPGMPDRSGPRGPAGVPSPAPSYEISLWNIEFGRGSMKRWQAAVGLGRHEPRPGVHTSEALRDIEALRARKTAGQVQVQFGDVGHLTSSFTLGMIFARRGPSSFTAIVFVGNPLAGRRGARERAKAEPEPRAALPTVSLRRRSTSSASRLSRFGILSCNYSIHLVSYESLLPAAAQ